MLATGDRQYDTVKTCSNCRKEYTELYESYTISCPECQLEQRGILIQTEGGWVWQKSTD